MNTMSPNQDPVKQARTPLLVAGILLMLLGGAGIVLPDVLSLAIELFIGWLMVAAGVMWIYYSYQRHRNTFASWLKPLILVIGGVMLLVYPSSGIAALTLVMSFYLLTDSFGSLSLAFEIRPMRGWGWMLLNALLSLALGLLILIGWPATSAVYLGIIIGISLLFDGLALFMIGIAIKS